MKDTSRYALKIINEGKIYEADVVEWVSRNANGKPISYEIVCQLELEKYGTVKLRSEEMYYDVLQYIETPMKVACFMLENHPDCYYLDFRGVLPGYPGPPLEDDRSDRDKQT